MEVVKHLVNLSQEYYHDGSSAFILDPRREVEV